MRTLTLSLIALTLLGTTAAVCAQGRSGDPLKRLAQADSNHDGRISLQEFRDARAARFEKIDRNHDGYFTDDDLPRFLRNNSRMNQRMQAMEKMADTDKDGRISRDEYMAAGEKMFSRLDRNGDGFIDQGELQQAEERMKSMAAQRGSTP